MFIPTEKIKINISVSLKENYMDGQIHTLVLMEKEKRSLWRPQRLSEYIVHTPYHNLQKSGEMAGGTKQQLNRTYCWK